MSSKRIPPFLPSVHRKMIPNDEARRKLLSSSSSSKNSRFHGTTEFDQRNVMGRNCCHLNRNYYSKKWICKTLIFLNLVSIMCFGIYYKLATDNYFRYELYKIMKNMFYSCVLSFTEFCMKTFITSRNIFDLENVIFLN